MTLGERIKTIRKSLQPKMSQEKFAEILGTTRPALAVYEIDRVVPTNAFINLICLKFKVNEKWLRTGEGEMFAKESDNLLEEVVQEYGLDTPLQRKAMELFLKSDSSQRQATLEAIQRFSKMLEEEDPLYHFDSDPPSDVEEILKMYLMLSEPAQVDVKNFITYRYEQERSLGEESSDAAIEN